MTVAPASADLSPIERLQKRLGEGASASLQREVLSAENMKPRVTIAKGLAFVLSLAVFGIALAILAAGVLLLLTGRFFPMLVGAGLVGIAWLARPRFDKVPDDSVPTDEMPRLGSVVDRIAQLLGTKPPDIIRVDGGFNASVDTAGWRQVRVLTIGLPLFAVLTPQEQVAILAHELGHFTSGDPRRTMVPGSALDTAIRWHLVLRPRSLMGVEEERLPGLVALPINIIMGSISLIPLGIAALLITLMARESQRGEYRADAEAARVAGSTAAASALDKLHLGGLVHHVASAATDEGWANRNLWDELSEQSTRIPELEFERFREFDRASAARLTLTHPPTASRMEVLSVRPRAQPALMVGPVDAEGIQAELRRQMAPIQEEIMETYRDSLLNPDTAVAADFGTLDYPRPNQDWLM